MSNGPPTHGSNDPVNANPGSGRGSSFARAAPASWADILPAGRPAIMGIVNVTPDSFSDGGRHASHAAAIDHGRRLLAEGADILDIGGESTRPGADPVSAEEEQRRVLPVIAALADDGALISIDSYRAATMRLAVDAGAAVINDVTALTGDPDSMAAAAAAGCPVVLMHMRGAPKTMQVAPDYHDVVQDVTNYLVRQIARCAQVGIPRARIALDPGIGFGKTVAHNAALMRGLPTLRQLGCPILIGFSRKSTIAKISAGEPADQRLPGSIAGALFAFHKGAKILRVHDVAATRQALAVWQALEGTALTD